MSFSLTYLLTKEDFSSYDKKIRGTVYLMRLKQMLLPLILIVAAGLLMDKGYFLTGIVFIVPLIFFPDILN